MMKGKYHILSILLAVTMVFAMVPIGAGLPLQAAETAYADNVPAADVTYTEDWEGTLLINESKTVKISGITHNNDQTEYESPIKIANKATVNLVFEGENVLTGNTTKDSCGIEVGEDSTVNIYGLDGSSLTVTGGKNGAGIGGTGCGSPGKDNPPAGNVIIHSGTITAIGGQHGAGIGSGYHSSAGNITIKGGDVTAFGTVCGAGIGSGYGTSGGAAYESTGNPTGAGVGFYQGGTITISGGKVRAAAWQADFSNFDRNNPDSLYGAGYSNTFAAGIGGGYGSSSGTIIIQGNADVVALGSSGAAGIGTGRGTTKVKHYDENNAKCNITIGGSAKVVAMALKDTRQGQATVSGAGIGLGYGWTIEGTTKGSIAIEDKADIYAYADVGANGIGTSKGLLADNTGTVPAAHIEKLTIGPNCTVAAVCGEPEPYRDAFDENIDLNAIAVTALNFDEDFFYTANIGDNTPFFTEDKFPAVIDVCSAGSSKPLASFSLKGPVQTRAGVHLPQGTAANAYYSVADYELDNGGRILLGKSVSENGWKFGIGQNDVKVLLSGKYSIKYNLNSGKNSVKNPVAYNTYGPAVKLADPTRSGYNFGGWYDNAKLTGSKMTTIPVGSIGDKQLWAKWTKKSEPKPDVKVSGTSLAKMTAEGKNSLVLSWNKIEGAEGYDVFFVICGDNKTCKLVKTIKGNKTLSWTKTGLKEKKAYKAFVRAYVMKDGKKTYVRTSPMVHAYTSGATKGYTNPKSVTVKKTKVSLKAGKTYKIKASVKKLKKGKKLMPAGHAPKLRYLSSDTKIAAVSAKGKITAKAKGTCKIYVYTVNGAYKTVKVTVK